MTLPRAVNSGPEKKLHTRDHHREQVVREDGEQDAQNRRHRNADDDRAAPERGRKTRRRHADDDGVVARHDDVDDDDAAQSREFGSGKKAPHARYLPPAAPDSYHRSSRMTDGRSIATQATRHKARRAVALASGHYEWVIMTAGIT